MNLSLNPLNAEIVPQQFFLKGWLFHEIINEGWYVIKQRKESNQPVI